jgi:membrane glycosyltransferase
VEQVVVSEGVHQPSAASEPVSDSHTREIDARARAERRVAEYLRAQGLNDEARIAALVSELMGEAELRNQAVVAPAAAVTRAQARLERWRSEVFGAHASEIDPLWLRAFAAAHPEAFLGPCELSRERAGKFGDARAGSGPVRTHFHAQAFERARIPRWLKVSLPATLLTALLVALAFHDLARDGLNALELCWLASGAFLVHMAALGASTAWLGLGRERVAAQPESAGPLPRTALVMPIYHEDPEAVFAGLLAMRESLAATPGGEAFEIFVLSDSRAPEKAAEEERAFRRVAALAEPNIPIYYRRRARNHQQKAGNLAEFFERWGNRYTYAVILDADSLMRGDTLVKLVRRMEAAPEVALLQAPLALHGSRTLFARTQQLTASVLGPMFMRGLARASGPHGNYYGHNAIVRVRAFLECCALPRLAGEPPLGGHILSHDFVEAALLCRAGWQVRLAHDLTGSWEELPPTLGEYVARDRRWCQGNLQHLRIVFAQGLRPMSRLHMLVGAFAYLASPVWLLFVVLGNLLAFRSGAPLLSPLVAITLAGTSAALLVGPRVLGLVATIRERERRDAHGGALSLLFSIAGELLIGLFLAPILMLHHTRIIFAILVGRAAGWGSQNRRGGGQFATIVRAEALTTLCGLATAVTLFGRAPSLFFWLMPLWLPWLLAIPFVAVVSSEAAGRAARKLGLFVTPEERAPDALLTRAHELCALTSGDEVARFRDLVLDPVLLASHLERLRDAAAPADELSLIAARQRALRMGPAALCDTERRLLLSSRDSMRLLHHEAWRSWPVESWQLGREVAQLPPEF